MKDDKFIRTQKILRIATVDANGNPHIVPVWYRYMGKKIYVGTNTRTVKAKNVKQNHRISFCIDVGINSPDIYGVMGIGMARLIRDDRRVKSIAKKILSRYFESLENKSAQHLLKDTDCIIEIMPKKISAWKY